MSTINTEKTTPKTSVSAQLVAAFIADPSLLPPCSAKDVLTRVNIEGATEQSVYNARMKPEIVALREQIAGIAQAEESQAVLATASEATEKAEAAVEAVKPEKVSRTVDETHPRIERFNNRLAKAGKSVQSDNGAVAVLAKANRPKSDNGTAAVVAKTPASVEEPSRGFAAALAVPFVWCWKAVLLPVFTFTNRVMIGWHARKVQAESAGTAFYQFVVTSKVIMLAGIVGVLMSYWTSAFLTLTVLSVAFIGFRAVWWTAMYCCGAFTAMEAGYRLAEKQALDKASKLHSRVSEGLERQTAEAVAN